MSMTCVLVVDDQVLNLDLVECVLDAAGVRVRCAVDAVAARESLRNERPDLILLDIQLPGEDGLSLARELKADASLARVPLIAFTAHAMSGDEARFRAAGFDGYLAKPIDVASFADSLRRYVAQAAP